MLNPLPTTQKAAMEFQKTRLSITSNDTNIIDNVCAKLLRRANKLGLIAIGPISMLTKTLTIKRGVVSFVVGKDLYRNFEMCVYQKMVDILSYPEVAQQLITSAVKVRNVNIGVAAVTSVNGRTSIEPWRPVLSVGEQSVASD